MSRSIWGELPILCELFGDFRAKSKKKTGTAGVHLKGTYRAIQISTFIKFGKKSLISINIKSISSILVSIHIYSSPILRKLSYFGVLVNTTGLNNALKLNLAIFRLFTPITTYNGPYLPWNFIFLSKI